MIHRIFKARWFFAISFAICVLMFIIQYFYNKPLISYEVPLGIASLELARDVDTTQKIFNQWGPEQLVLARHGLYWDYGFLVSYGVVIFLSCRWAGNVMTIPWNWPNSRRVGNALAYLGILAASFDAIEDFSLLWEIQHGAAWLPAATAWSSAMLKFGLIGICLGFQTGGIIAWSPVLNAHAKFAINHIGIMAGPTLLFSLIFGFVGRDYGVPSLFWNDDPLTLLSASFGATLLLLVIGVIVYYDQRDVDGGVVEVVAGIRPWGQEGAKVSQNLEYLSRFLGRGGIPLLVMLSLPILLPRLFPFVPNVPFQRDGTSFALWTTYGRSLVWLAGILLGVLAAKGLMALSILSYSSKEERITITRSLFTFYSIFVGIYLLLTIRPLYDWVSPAFGICAFLVILTMAIAFATSFAPLIFPGLRDWWIHPSFVVGFLLIAWFGVANHDPFKHAFPRMDQYYPASGGRLVDLRDAVRRHYFPRGPFNEANTMAPVATLISDRETLEAWRRVARLPKNQDKPKLAVVVVSGGAARSAYWSATVLQRIETRIPGFSNNVRIIAGASGGMLGTACYVEELHRRNHGFKSSTFLEIVPTDSIKPVARYIALNEIWRAFLPFRTISDRGMALQNDWKTLQNPLQSYRKEEADGTLPSLIFSPMMAEDGRRLLISNLDLEAICKSQGALLTDREASLNLHDYSLSAIEFFKLFPEARDFQVATAVRMNATFPFVSPAVNLPTDPPRRVVDAAYYDNFGVQVASAWIEKNLDWLLEKTSGVVLIQIRDSISQQERLEVADPPEGIFASIRRGFQFFTSPLDAASQANYTVTAFRNDQDVSIISSRFHSRIAQIASTKPGNSPDDIERIASNFFTTAIFENSAIVTFGSSSRMSWPGDELEDIQTSRDVTLDWYLSQAERDGLDRAIPTPSEAGVIPHVAVPETAPIPPAGSNWCLKENRVLRLNWLREQVANTRGPKRDQWLKEYEQARNFERLEQLYSWWNPRLETPVCPQ